MERYIPYMKIEIISLVAKFHFQPILNGHQFQWVCQGRSRHSLSVVNSLSSISDTKCIMLFASV